MQVIRRPTRNPTSSRGEIEATAGPMREKKAPEAAPYHKRPIIVPAVPTPDGVHNANMQTDETNPTEPKTRHTPTRSARTPIDKRPTTLPEPAMAIA